MANAKGRKVGAVGGVKSSVAGQKVSSHKAAPASRPSATVDRTVAHPPPAAAKPPAARPVTSKPTTAKPSGSAKLPAKGVPAKAPVPAAIVATAKATVGTQPLVPAPEPVAAGTPSGDPAIKTKKKAKRGAPPMLPRRLTRRPMPAATGAEGLAPLPPHKATAPGSLHTPARVPDGAEGLKARLGTVNGHLARLRGLKRSLVKQFWDAGNILDQLSDPLLVQAKGYGSWEAFLEREIERELAIGRMTAMDLVRIVRVFKRETAEEFGFERLREAVKKLWPDPSGTTGTPAATGTNEAAPRDPEGGGA